MIRRTAHIGFQYGNANQTYATKSDKTSDMIKKIWKDNPKTVTNERGTYKVNTLTAKKWEEQCDKNLKALLEQDLEKRGLSPNKKN